MAVTKQDVKISFMVFGEIVVPQGTRITHKTATGIDYDYNFVDEFGWIDRDYPTVANILKMDARNYGINIPAEFVTKDYSWEWVARVDGVEIGRGIREMNEGEFFDTYRTNNLPGLIERWNGAQCKHSPDGQQNIKWTYKQL